ncbi:MAG: hypothetical protein M1839_008982 [Geoglossum umbratile]|nr:MAG: hypothetical protein M1839_008982 [Geoglossum umbratile]
MASTSSLDSVNSSSVAYASPAVRPGEDGNFTHVSLTWKPDALGMAAAGHNRSALGHVLIQSCHYFADGPYLHNYTHLQPEHPPQTVQLPHKKVYPFAQQLYQRQGNRACHRQAHNCPPRPYNLLIQQLLPGIPDQMPNAIPAVIRKRQADKVLGSDLCGNGPGGKGGGDALGLEVPAEERGDEVGGGEEVERAAEERAADAVEGRAVPGDLRAVDGEVGRDGAAFALLGQDGVRGGRGESLGCEGPGIAVRLWVGGWGRGFGGERILVPWRWGRCGCRIVGGGSAHLVLTC